MSGFQVMDIFLNSDVIGISNKEESELQTLLFGLVSSDLNMEQVLL
jgi:hypothetical protein